MDVLIQEQSRKLLNQASTSLLLHPVLVTQYCKMPNEKIPIANLNDIAEMLIKEEKKEQRIRTRFCVHGVNPGQYSEKNYDFNINDFVKVQNIKTGKLREASKTLKKDEQYVMQMQLFCKDYSNDLQNTYVKVDVFEKDNQKSRTSLFPGLKPGDLYHNKEGQERLKKFISLVLQFNTWVEGILEFHENSNILVLKDTFFLNY